VAENDPTVSSRRNFLKAIGGAVGAATLPLGGAAATTIEESEGYDVVVVGGGFAGVTAARELQHAGLRTLIVEARNRLGGRTFTTRVDGELFELGGTWVHSTQPHVFAEATRYGLELVETQDEIPARVMWWDGENAREAGIGDILPVLKDAFCAKDGEEIDAPFSALQAFSVLSHQMSEFHSGAATAFPRPFDPFSGDAWRGADTLSVRDRLDQMDLPESHAGLIEGVLGASAHGSFSEASFAEMLRWWALAGEDLTRYSDSVARYRFRDGTESLIQAMLADGRPDTRLATPVAEIVQNGEQVEVVTEDGERIRTRAVIAALPMNVLSKIRFSPDLDPEIRTASEERHSGSGVKVYIKLQEAIPPTSIFARETEPFSSIFSLATSHPGAELVAFGTDPSRIDVHDKAAVQAVIRRFFPDANVVSTLTYDWNLDPYSLGTWCVLRKGQMTRFLPAVQEPHGLVHFAGADIALGWRGFIDGAIESGNRIAHEVIARLKGRPQPQTTADAETSGNASRAFVAPVAFQQCAVCHPTDESGKHGVGPNLRGVVGRPAGNTPSFAYSRALGSRDTQWTRSELEAFLTDPAAYAPGTIMPFAGLKDSTDRTAVIRYLSELK